MVLRPRALNPAATRSSNDGNGHVVSTNGDATAPPAHPQLLSTVPLLSANMDSPALHALFDEIKLLGRQIEQANLTRSNAVSGEALEGYLNYTNSLLEALPGMIADAVSDALAKQHKLIVREVEAALGAFLRDLGARSRPR